MVWHSACGQHVEAPSADQREVVRVPRSWLIRVDVTAFLPIEIRQNHIRHGSRWVERRPLQSCGIEYSDIGFLSRAVTSAKHTDALCHGVVRHSRVVENVRRVQWVGVELWIRISVRTNNARSVRG